MGVRKGGGDVGVGSGGSWARGAWGLLSLPPSAARPPRPPSSQNARRRYSVPAGDGPTPVASATSLFNIAWTSDFGVAPSTLTWAIPSSTFTDLMEPLLSSRFDFN